MYVLFINWDAVYSSPPIGPFESLGEAQLLATKIRRRLWCKGVKRQKHQVEICVLRQPESIWGWEGLQ